MVVVELGELRRQGRRLLGDDGKDGAATAASPKADPNHSDTEGGGGTTTPVKEGGGCKDGGERDDDERRAAAAVGAASAAWARFMAP